MEAIVERDNLRKALARARRNNGAPGIDGMSVDDLAGHLKDRWLTIKAQLLDGAYRPLPVRLPQIRRLTEICAPDTQLIAVGERNDIVLYRDLKAAGVAEYFYKPLITNVVDRTLMELSGVRKEQPSHGGRLIFVLGVRGGVGATTIATNLAWCFGEVRQRRVLLLYLDLHDGDTALQLRAEPTPALREALEHPQRVDELFLARGVIPVSKVRAVNRYGVRALTHFRCRDARFGG